MTYALPEDPNPFQAPRAELNKSAIDLGTDEEAEIVRRTYLSHEASVKSIGLLNYLGGFFFVIFGILLIVGAVAAPNLGNLPPNFTPESFRIVLGVAGIGLLFLAALSIAVGYGLAHLQVWSRWTVIVLQGLGFVTSGIQLILTGATEGAEALGGAVVGTFLSNLIPIYIFYLVASAKGAMVFSREYKEVIRKTPYIKYKTSLIVKILLALLLIAALFLVIGMIAALNRTPA